MFVRNMAAFLVLALMALSSAPAAAQEGGLSLADLARQARERKRAAADRGQVVESLDYAVQCRIDWDCLIAALDARKRARMRIPDTMDLSEDYGAIITSEVLLEIRDCTEEVCMLTGGTENTTVRIGDAMRAHLLLNGWSAEQVNERERAAQARVKPQDEAKVTCRFRINRLREFLELRKQGSTADQDWDLADRCEGLDQTITNPFAPPAP